MAGFFASGNSEKCETQDFDQALKLTRKREDRLGRRLQCIRAMASKPTILIVGTLDTKLEENLYLRSSILNQGTCQTKILDVSGTYNDGSNVAEALQSEVLSPLKDLAEELSQLSRGDYVNKAIATALPVVREMVQNDEIHGIVSAAGSTGSSLATALMRDACHVGFPKLMVSTMASGDIKPYIQETDITMMYSVLDIAGNNSLLKQILTNAAGAICGMTVAHGAQKRESPGKGKRIAITMFGVTTPCVEKVQNILTSPPHDVSEHEFYVFHATGAGGKAMERLIDEGQIDAVLDLTTTEIADELVGGVLTAGPERLDAAVQAGIPVVLATGACDMVNFGPKDTVPEHYKERNLYVHNPTVTLMRTTKEENKQIGEFIAKKLSKAKDPTKIRVMLPKGGVSMIDKEGQPFHDPEADDVLFRAIAEGLVNSKIEVFAYPENINDDAFAVSASEHLLEVMGIDPRQYRLANTRRRRWSFDHGKTLHAVRRASMVDIPDA